MIRSVPDLIGSHHFAAGFRIELEHYRIPAINIIIPEMEVPGANILPDRGERRSLPALDVDWAISTARCISPHTGIIRQFAGECATHGGEIDFNFLVFII